MAEVMRSVLLSSDTILSVPEPGVLVTALDADAVELELSFRVADLSATGKAKSEIYDLIWRHAKAGCAWPRRPRPLSPPPRRRRPRRRPPIAAARRCACSTPSPCSMP